ncbi:MAG: hypothetical protein KAX05_15565 [Bacteroidales bacterium]|nr:hypothetical protein [Bacteroidales bacterium]
MENEIYSLQDRIAFIEDTINRKRLGTTNTADLTFILTLDIKKLLERQCELSGIRNGMMEKQNELLQLLLDKPVQKIVQAPAKKKVTSEPVAKKKNLFQRIFNK